VLLEVGVYHFDEVFWERRVRFADAWLIALERSFADLSKGQYGA
jgi:hypothetical protein